jgi:hypothetical protein
LKTTSNKKAAGVVASPTVDFFNTKPATPPAVKTNGNDPTPVSAFPIDHIEEPRRGPGRPPKICSICNKSASECKGHAPAQFQIGESTVKGLMQMVAHLAALSFSMSSGVPLESLSKIWLFSEGEQALIAPPAAEIINEHAPEWLLRYEKEIKLGLVLVPVLITKLTITHAMVKMHKEQKEKQVPANASPSPAAAKPESTVAAQATAA